jgi:glycosyltransferase involved in cell wall biosynthesis
MRGWVADTNQYENKLRIEILCDGKVVASGDADVERDDLKAAGIGDGKHGFSIQVPPELFDGTTHQLTARAIGFEQLFGPISFTYSGEIRGEILGLHGFRVSGQVRLGTDHQFKEPLIVELLENGKVLASVTADDEGDFEVALHRDKFDGKLHSIQARLQYPPIELDEIELFLPVISAQDAARNCEQYLGEKEIDNLILGQYSEEEFDFLVKVIYYSNRFDYLYYRQVSGLTLGFEASIRHFLQEGGELGLIPFQGFSPNGYRLINDDLKELSDKQCFVHYVLRGHNEKRYFNLAQLGRDAAEMRLKQGFESSWYETKYSNLLGDLRAEEHYLAMGWRKGFAPNRIGFDSTFYMACYEDARLSSSPPYLHFLKQKGKRITKKNEIKDFVAGISSPDGFDAKYYRTQLIEPLNPDIPEALHYLLEGERKGLDPREDFCSAYYSEKYTDLRTYGTSLFVHYIKHGKNEGRVAKFHAEQFITAGGAEFNPSNPTVIVVCHEASRTGAPILGLRLVEHFSRRANVISWNGKIGAITAEFAKSCVAMINAFPDHVDTVWLVKEIKRRFAPQFAVVNSVCTVGVAAALYEEKIPLLALVHEYADYMGKQVVQMLKYANQVVFPSNGVKSSADLAALKAYEGYTRNTIVRHQGRCIPPFNEEGRVFDEEDILLGMGISEDDEKPAIVLGCGWVQIRKGIEYFIEAARVVKAKLNRPVRFVWVGGGYKPDTDLLYSSWLRSQIINSDLEEEIVFFEETVDLDPFFELADVFFLPSRLDPFPNVAIDAVDAGVPIVAFERGTGFAEFIEAHPSVGVAVPFLDVEAASAAICDYIEGKRTAQGKSKELSKLFSFADYADFVWSEGADMVKQQQLIEEESRLLEVSGLLNADFFHSARTGWNNILPPEYEYVSMWARGISLAKSRPGFNDKLATYDLADVGGNVITPLANTIKLEAPPFTHDVLYINHEQLSPEWSGKLKVAMHIHAHYTDSLQPLLHRLGSLDQKIRLFITTNKVEKADAITDVLDAFSLDAEVVMMPNRGRDIGPFIMLLQEKFTAFDIVGHFHLKGTKQLDQTLVRQWQDFLYDSLLGKNGEVLNEILHALEHDSKLGLLFQEEPNLLGWNKNLKFAHKIAEKLKLTTALPEDIEYPTGNMFWARTAALTPLLRKNWEWKDFPAEPVPYDGSILHAIERLTPVICEDAGYHWVTVFNPLTKRCRTV